MIPQANAMRSALCAVLLNGPHSTSRITFAPLHSIERENDSRDQDQGFHCCLPFPGIVLSLRKLRDVIAGVLERAAAG